MRQAHNSAQRPVRVDVDLPVTLTTSDNHVISVRIRDISATGFRFDLPAGEELVVGENIVVLTNGKEKWAGQVRWTLGNEAGATIITDQA